MNYHQWKLIRKIRKTEITQLPRYFDDQNLISRKAILLRFKFIK